MKGINFKIPESEHESWKAAAKIFGRRNGSLNPDRCLADFIRSAVRLEVGRLLEAPKEVERTPESFLEDV